jgi:deoxyinosine 3'endonuclease (endonuclease V)
MQAPATAAAAATSTSTPTAELESQWRAEQDKLRQQIVHKDSVKLDDIKYVGGLDISFDKKDPDRACAYLCVVDCATLKPVYEDWAVVRLTMPYVSGFLAFREVPHFLPLLAKLERDKPEYKPSVLLVDGNGTLHHRGCGSASHLGVVSGYATVGCAKTLLFHDGLVERAFRREFAADKALLMLPLQGASGQVHGMALRATQESTNPIYVSAGHKITLDTAVTLVQRLSQYRVPEPVRLADINSKRHL